LIQTKANSSELAFCFAALKQPAPPPKSEQPPRRQYAHPKMKNAAQLALNGISPEGASLRKAEDQAEALAAAFAAKDL
jgi:hypothetical protein